VDLTAHQTGVVFLLFGIFLVLGGLKADYIIDTSVVSATEEEIRNSKATLLSRLVVVLVGLIVGIDGLLKLLR
jgi:hypothetical protein